MKSAGARQRPGMYTSLPMRESGLKSHLSGLNHRFPHVAPHAGAWIEIYTIEQKVKGSIVAPYAGAWIKMPASEPQEHVPSVAPCVGVELNMIEIFRRGSSVIFRSDRNFGVNSQVFITVSWGL